MLAFVGAYYGGWLDALLRGIVDVGLTIPGLMVLIVIAMVDQAGPDRRADGAGRRLARLALPSADDPRAGADHPRAELRPDRAAVGHAGPEVIFKEIVPNLLPYLAASLVNCDLGRGAGVDRPRSARPRPDGRTRPSA